MSGIVRANNAGQSGAVSNIETIDSDDYVDASIDNAHLADDAVDSDELAAGAVDTAHIGNNQVTGAKLNPSLVLGDIIYADGTDTIARLAKGSADEVLTMGGSNAPTWAAAGGGAMVLIGTTVATDDATIGVTGLDSTYDTYLILLSDVVPASDGVDGRMQVGDSSGYDVGASDYAYHFNNSIESGSTHNGSNSTGDTGMRFNGAGMGNAAGEGIGVAMWLHRPGDGTTVPMFSGTFISSNNAGAISGGSYVGRRTAVITLDRVQFKYDSGNVATGRISVYGVSHA